MVANLQGAVVDNTFISVATFIQNCVAILFLTGRISRRWWARSCKQNNP
jgi:hypothetical protein